MRFIVLSRKNIFVYFVCFICVVAGIFASVFGTKIAVNTATQKKELPIYCVDKEEKLCSISFDAAWGNEQTSDLLKILQQYNVKSTFFLVGNWVDKYPESVKEIYDSGNEVCNHSDTHAHMNKLSNEKLREEIENCNNKIQNITGKRPELFRAPYGEYNNNVVNCVNNLNMYCVQWDVDSLDWKDPSAQEISDRIMKNVKPGSIILMHNGAKNTPQALPIVLSNLQKEGYKIVPISELIYKNTYEIDNNGKQIEITEDEIEDRS